MYENICYMLSYKDYYDIKQGKIIKKNQVNKNNYYKYIPWFFNYEAKLDLKTETSEGVIEFSIFNISISYIRYNSFILNIYNKIFQLEFEGSLPNNLNISINNNCTYTYRTGLYKKIPYLGHHVYTIGSLNYGFKTYKYNIKIRSMNDNLGIYYVYMLGVFGVVLSDSFEPLALVSFFSIGTNSIIIQNIIYAFDVHFRKLQMLKC